MKTIASVARSIQFVALLLAMLLGLQISVLAQDSSSGADSADPTIVPDAIESAEPNVPAPAAPPQLFTLTMVAGPNGSTNPPPGQRTYAPRTPVTISAIPASGYAFSGWVGQGPGSYTGPLNPAPIVMHGNIRQSARFSIAGTHQLTMVAGEGGVVSPGSGPYPHGAIIYPLAIPNEGFAFTGWVGTGEGSYTGPDTSPIVYMYSDVSETAAFTPLAAHTLTMISTGPGHVMPSTATHYHGALVQLQAIADSGFDFLGWTGEGPGSYTGLLENPTVEMNNDMTQTANFGTIYHTVTMIPNAHGSIEPPSGIYANNSVLEISATPDSGYVLFQWIGTGEGSYSGPNRTATITVRGPITQVAEIDPAYQLEIGVSGPGSASPSSGPYPQHHWFQIHAVPDSGAVFLGWIGTGQGSYTGYSRDPYISMNSPITEVAHFGSQDTTLSLLMTVAGSGSVLPGSGTYHYGDQVQIQAIPGPYANFSGWYGYGDGAYSGGVPTTTITMLGNVRQHASFYTPSYLLRVLGGPGGSVSPPSKYYLKGTQVAVVATPHPGYLFERWVGLGAGSYSGTNNPATVTVLDTTTQTASFVVDPSGFQVTISSIGEGSTSPPSGIYPLNQQLAIHAVPDSGYVFERWAGTGLGSYSGPVADTSIVVLGLITETAIFKLPAGVTLTSTPPGQPVHVDGQAHTTPAQFDWPAGSIHSVAADSILALDATSRLRFKSWSNGLARVHQFTCPDSAATLHVEFATDYRLEMPATPEGTLLPGTTWQESGSEVALTATAASGYVFTSWTGSGEGSYTGTANPATATMLAPIVQTAEFTKFGFNFTISASDTDPFAHTAAPSGGIRNLYLWVTCADEGISAFQGSTTGTLSPLTFVPASGVFNIGTTTSLLLAVSGCTSSPPGPRVLGSWIVIDTGGSFCISPSAEGALFGAVDCDAAHPSFVENPHLVGFSSAGGAPCTVGVNPCGTPAANPPAATGASVLPYVPLETALSGAQPNPFSGATEIRYSVAVPGGRVQIKVYDVSGRLVEKIVDSVAEPGEFRVSWGGRGAHGTSVPAGVYFITLELGASRHTRKIVYLGEG